MSGISARSQVVSRNRAIIELFLPRKLVYDGPPVDPEIPVPDVWACQIMGYYQGNGKDPTDPDYIPPSPDGTLGQPATVLYYYNVRLIGSGEMIERVTTGFTSQQYARYPADIGTYAALAIINPKATNNWEKYSLLALEKPYTCLDDVLIEEAGQLKKMSSTMLLRSSPNCNNEATTFGTEIDMVEGLTYSGGTGELTAELKKLTVLSTATATTGNYDPPPDPTKDKVLTAEDCDDVQPSVYSAFGGY